MTAVFWLEQTEQDVPAADDWLGPNEATRLSGLRVPKRRTDWRLGRWTAKQALATCLELAGDAAALRRLEIIAAPSGAPEAYLDGRPVGIQISLSHRAGAGICSVAASAETLGCDLELIEDRSYAFTADYFTAGEQMLVSRASAADRPRLIALLWSVKESALKALRTGLRIDTRSVVVNGAQAVPFCGNNNSGSWYPIEVRYNGGQSFQGWWRQKGSFVLSVVAVPPPRLPILLEIAATHFSTHGR